MKPITTTWTGDSSYTTSIGTRFTVLRVSLTYRDGSGNLTSITNDCTVSIDKTEGDNYDEIVTVFDNASGATSNLALFEPGELRIDTGSQLKVACNVGANNAYLTIDYDLL